MFAKIKKVLIVLPLLLIAVPTYAGIVTITDDFDIPANTATLWDNFGGSWDHPVLDGSDLGYRAVTATNGTAAFIDNQQQFDMANLSMNTLLQLDANGAVGFLLNSDSPLTTGNYDEYGILCKKDAGQNGRLEVWYNNVTTSGETNTSRGGSDADITINSFYRLQLSTNSQGYIDVDLFDLSGNTLASLPDVIPTPFTSGIVGIATSDAATFNDFSLTGNAVPIPGAVWLLGSGLIGLVGLRKKLKK